MTQKLYEKFRDIWKDKPDKTTPVTAEALNHIEQGIYDNSENIIELGKNMDGLSNYSYISSQSNINGSVVEITVTIDGIASNNNFIAGGFFQGILILGIPPMLLNANISITRYSNNEQKIDGYAELINTYASTTPQFGNVFDGSIELITLRQNSETTCEGTVKMIFNLGLEYALNVQVCAVFRVSQYYYPMAKLRSDLTERIELLEQRIAELEKEE